MNRIAGLDHFVIGVSDRERSTRFYRDVLGAEVVDLGSGRIAYRMGQIQLNVHGPDTDQSSNVARLPVMPGNSDFCVAWIGTLPEAVDHLRKHGVEPELGPVQRPGARGTGTSVYFRDPVGSLLELITYS
jgi:catechol 2,3-dioxygenase-like lactoylglutathione lyase family enzyme